MNAKTEIIRKANKLIKTHGTNDPFDLADRLGIIVKPTAFTKQRGAYTVLLRNRFIFLSDALDEAMTNIVMWHEIGHDQLHRKEAIAAGSFQEFNIFDMRSSRMEYEANLFAAQLALPDDEVLEMIYAGYDVEQIARTMNSDINLVALKCEIFNSQGYGFYPQGYDRKFLKYRN